MTFGDSMRWYSRAAEVGFAPAQLNLGVLYAKGDGVEPDPVEAWVWFDRAASKDQPQAEIFRSRLEGMMSEAERRRVRAAAKKRRARLAPGQAR